MTCIPPNTLSSLNPSKIPGSKRDLQHALGLLVFWRKHIPGFSIIARPLYDLLWKKAKYKWTQVHHEALQLLVFEANAYQALGPINPTDPVQTERGFARTGLSTHLWQKVPEGPIQPIRCYLYSFKDAETIHGLGKGPICSYSSFERGRTNYPTAAHNPLGPI